MPASQSLNRYRQRYVHPFAEDIHHKMMANPTLYALHPVALLAIVVFTAGECIIRWKSRLILDVSGIRYTSPQPSWIKGLYADWSANWSDITGARVAPSSISGMTITIDTASQRKKLKVFEWVDSTRRNDTIDPAIFRRKSNAPFQRKTKPPDLAKALEEKAIMQYLRARNTAVDVDIGRASPGSAGAGGFDLGSNRHAGFALLLFVALAAYAAIEALSSPRLSNPDTPLLGVSIGAGVLIALLFAVWLRKANVPNIESTIIALSLGGASAAVLYFAL